MSVKAVLSVLALVVASTHVHELLHARGECGRSMAIGAAAGLLAILVRRVQARRDRARRHEGFGIRFNRFNDDDQDDDGDEE